MAAIDPFRLDAILGDKAQPSDVFGLNRVLGKPREPEGLGSALSRGFVEAAQQVPQLLGGLQAGAGAALESAFGEGGIGTAIKESGLERYKKWEDKIQAGSRESDSWDYSWEQATENGDRGALAKWIAHGIGYTGGQGLQMLLGAGVGTIAGKAALGKVAQTVANGMVRREAGQIAAATAAKELGETATKEAIAAKAAELALLPELQKEAVKAAAGTIGRNAVIGASAFGQEAGEIFGDLTQKAQEEGRTLTGSELGRAFWSSVAAGGLEFVGDKLSLNVMLGKSRVLKGAQYAEGLGGRAARAALGSVAIAPAEAATEYFQTGLEEYGKGTEQNIIPAFQSEAGQKQAREAAMLGGLGGLVMGGAGGALHGPRPRPTARDILASTSVDDAIGTFVDSLGQSNAPMAGKPLTGRELRAANAGVLDYVRALDPGEQAEALRLLADVQNPNLPAGPKRFAQDRLGELFASVHKIPVGEVEEVSQIPAGEATEVMRDAIAADRAMDEFRSKYAEQLPIGEATDVVPEEVSPAPPAENRTPRVSTAAKELDFSGTTAMVKTFVDRMAAIGTPAARAFVSDYRAGRISDDDVFRAMSASEWVSPDQRISEASEALARAAAKRAPSAQPSDLLAPGDVPYRTKLSAMLRAKHEGLDNSTVVPAPDGGFVVRPREGVGHDAQGDQQGAGGTDVPRHIDAGRGGSADRGGIGIAGRGDTGVVEREGIHGGGTTDVGAVGAEQLTSQAASEATHATDQIAEQQSAGGEHRIGDQGRAAGEAGGGDRVQRAEAGQEAAAAQVAEDREFLRAFQDRKPSDASPSEAEIARAAEVRDRLASESLSALDGGATFKNAGIRFEADGDTHVVMTHDGLRLAFIDGARTRANVMTALRAAQLRKSGVSANDAGKQAVRERLESVGTQLETLEQERRKQFSERQQKSAVHVEPGEAPEVVTPAVVTEATKTAAENRNRKPSEMRAELLAMIDAAIPKAKYEDRSQVPRGRAARKTGDDYVRFRIKGDGVFTIMNSQDALREFREKVEKSPGFKDRTPRPTTPTWQTSARHGSSGPESAIKNMIDDGDPQAAVDYAAARGMNLADVLKGDKTRLDKVAGLTPTEAEAVGAFEPEAAEAKQGTTPPAEVGPEYTNAPDAATAQTANDVATGAATNARIENFGEALFSRASEDVRQDSNGARATAIRAAITKAYGGLLDALESRGLVTLTQTLDQAIALAARARSAATGRSVDESRRELMPDANRQTGGASMSDKTQIDPIYSRSGNVEGFHDPVTGKSFLVADNLTEMTAPGTLMHEVGVHMADAGVLEDMMRRGERLIREHSDEPMVRRAIKRMASAGETSPEEFVAYLVTEYENDRVNAPRSVRAFIRDLIAAIRAWLHKQGFVNTGSLTVADIAAIARANARSTASRRGGIGTRQEQGQDIRFSMAPAAQAVKDFTAALRGGSAKRFNALHRTIATQLHKASIDPDYGRVFAIGQEFERDIARATARAAALAPDVLPAFDNAKSAFWRVVHGAKGDEEVDKAGQALWAGTLENGPEADSGVVWSDEQLRERFGLGAEGSKLYRQARAAIDASLDETAAAIAFQLVKRNAGDLAGAIMEAPARARELIEERLGSEVTEAAQAYLADAKAMPNASEETKNVAAALKVLDRASALKAGGYAPLMRFGRYAVEVRDRDGTLVDFRKFDSELSAKMAEQRMRRQYPGASIERSVMSEDAWKLFAGVDPETVMLFADHIDGLDKDVKQQWYRAALSERSAMKHLIAPRKGMPGYSADLRRVLSSFIGSSARLAARQMHMGSMKAEISDMIDRKVSGDVIDEAQKLQEYLEAPDEPFKGTRSLLFTWYLGGSVASAAVNLTQPLMMTLPYLSQFGSAGKTMLGAIKESVSGKVNDATLAQALKRASDDGIVDPQTVHHLYHHGMKSLIDALPGGAGAKARAQGFSTLWGLMFGAAENFNRRITFISAYRMALADKTLGDPYAFAARAVEETQSIYSRGNRPNWARGTGAFGALGVAAFTFKQYSIAYVELLVRMAKAGPKGRLAAAAMLGMMALAAGMQGVPFAEDIEDLVDTVAQQLGYRGNTKASIREALIDAFGTGVADAMMYGASAGLPLDVSGRLGLGHLIPAIGIGKLTERDRRGKQLAELAGPIGGFYGSLMDAVEAAGAGKGGGEVIAAFAPIAVRNAMIGAQMAERGYYSDTRGRRVTDTDAGDAFIKALGFQPESVASVRRPQYLVAQDIARMRGVKQDISDLRARAIVEREPDLRVRAEEMLREWNTNNPDMRITINAADIMKRVTAARATSAERIKKTAPQQVRRRVAELLNAP